MAFENIFKRFKPSKKNGKSGDYLEHQPITLTPVYRKRSMTEDQRRLYATELLDTYYGFGSPYLAGYIKQSITNDNIRREMLKIVRCLPLLQFFTNSISRVYATQPTRKFYLDGKEIIKTPAELKKKKDNVVNDVKKNVNMDVNQNDKSVDNANEDVNENYEENEDKQFNELLNEDKFIHDDELFEALNNLYNDNITTSIKQAERFTNLFHTTIYKIVTDEKANVKMIFIPNDTVQVKPVNYDPSKAEQIAFVQDTTDVIDNQLAIVPIIENWTKDVKDVPMNQVDKDRLGITDEDNINQAALEYEKLFDTKEADSGFAPFVVFRDVGTSNDFWDQKDNDIVAYIKSINMSLTELKYLEKFTSFGLKYTVNIKAPEDGVMDPNGIINFAVANSAVPGVDNGKNFEIGEFTNAGSIDEVIKSIIFNMKMLFSLYNIPLDALISTNSVRSAENKQMDNDELFAVINAQRDIWNKNEQTYFKVAQAVHNRDNDYKIPKGVEMLVDYAENTSKEKTVDDWLVEIQNNISTAIDWLSDINPDLDRDELMDLLKSNKEINDKQKKEPINLNAFAQMDEEGNLIIPEDPNEKKSEDDSEDSSENSDDNSNQSKGKNVNTNS